MSFILLQSFGHLGSTQSKSDVKTGGAEIPQRCRYCTPFNEHRRRRVVEIRTPSLLVPDLLMVVLDISQQVPLLPFDDADLLIFLLLRR